MIKMLCQELGHDDCANQSSGKDKYSKVQEKFRAIRKANHIQLFLPIFKINIECGIID